MWGHLDGAGGEGEAGSGREAVAGGEGYGVEDHAEGGDFVMASCVVSFFSLCFWTGS